MERISAVSASITSMITESIVMYALIQKVSIMGSGWLMMMGVRSLKGKVKYAGRNGNNGR